MGPGEICLTVLGLRHRNRGWMLMSTDHRSCTPAAMDAVKTKRYTSTIRPRWTLQQVQLSRALSWENRNSIKTKNKKLRLKRNQQNWDAISQTSEKQFNPTKLSDPITTSEITGNFAWKRLWWNLQIKTRINDNITGLTYFALGISGKYMAVLARRLTVGFTSQKCKLRWIWVTRGVWNATKCMGHINKLQNIIDKWLLPCS